MTRPLRGLAAILLALGLLLGPAAPAPAQVDDGSAQGGGESAGDPWVGYAAAIFFSCATLFIVCKSARRSMAG